MSVEAVVKSKFDSKIRELVEEVEAMRRVAQDAVNRLEYERSREVRPLTYLACPYSSDDSTVRQCRYLEATKAAAWLTKEGHTVFSPVTHSHPISQVTDVPTSWTFWENHDRAYLSCCSKLVVLMLEGWDVSVGVQAEIAIAQSMGIPVDYMDPVIL